MMVSPYPPPSFEKLEFSNVQKPSFSQKQLRKFLSTTLKNATQIKITFFPGMRLRSGETEVAEREVDRARLLVSICPTANTCQEKIFSRTMKTITLKIIFGCLTRVWQEE